MGVYGGAQVAGLAVNGGVGVCKDPRVALQVPDMDMAWQSRQDQVWTWLVGQDRAWRRPLAGSRQDCARTFLGGRGVNLWLGRGRTRRCILL